MERMPSPFNAKMNRPRSIILRRKIINGNQERTFEPFFQHSANSWDPRTASSASLVGRLCLRWFWRCLASPVERIRKGWYSLWWVWRWLRRWWNMDWWLGEGACRQWRQSSGRISQRSLPWPSLDCWYLVCWKHCCLVADTPGDTYLWVKTGRLRSRYIAPGIFLVCSMVRVHPIWNIVEVKIVMNKRNFYRAAAVASVDAGKQVRSISLPESKKGWGVPH